MPATVDPCDLSLLPEEGSSSEPFCFVEQERFTLKEDILYANEWRQALRDVYTMPASPLVALSIPIGACPQ